MPSSPLYGQTHKRIRQALLAGGQWLGRPCPRCGEPMMDAAALDLDHATDELGRRTGGYVPGGLSHAACNRGANAFGWRRRKAQADAIRTPERQQEKDDLKARKERRQFRSEFDKVQEEIARGG